MDKNIPKWDLKITQSTRVCINHFQKQYVITHFPSTEGEPDIIVSIDNTIIILIDI